MLYRIVTKYLNDFRHSMDLSKAYFNYAQKQALPFPEVKRTHLFEKFVTKHQNDRNNVGFPLQSSQQRKI